MQLTEREKSEGEFIRSQKLANQDQELHLFTSLILNRHFVKSWFFSQLEWYIFFRLFFYCRFPFA